MWGEGSEVWSSAFRRYLVTLRSWRRRDIFGVNSIKSNARNYWNGARAAHIRGIPPPHRPNFGHLRFLISAACYEHRHYIGHSRHVLTTLSRLACGISSACEPNLRMVRIAESLPRTRRGGRHQTFGLSIGAASRPHFTHLEHRRTHPRTKGFLPRCRARDAFRSTLLGNVELCSSNPVRHGYVERWTDWPWSSAVETRPDRCERGEAFLAGVPDPPVRQELG